MTWEDIKLATLQKMFAADGDNLVVDESTKDYIAGMPQACNEGLQLLSTAGKFIVKSVCIANNPIPNLLLDSESMKITQLVKGTKEYEASTGHSYYFECMGKGTANIYVDDMLTDVITLDAKHYYKVYKGLIINLNDKNVKIVFECDYPISINNVAIYDASYEDSADIPSFAEKVRYNIKEYAPDFYELDSSEVYFEGDSDTHRYLQTSEFFHEGNKIFVVDRKMQGNFTIYYKAYPPLITTATDDEYELPVDDEVAVLLPLYMASQLYKDDEIDVATSYRNEFDIAFSQLRNKQSTPSAEEFTSESGWC